MVTRPVAQEPILGSHNYAEARQKQHNLHTTAYCSNLSFRPMPEHSSSSSCAVAVMVSATRTGGNTRPARGARVPNVNMLMLPAKNSANGPDDTDVESLHMS